MHTHEPKYGPLDSLTRQSLVCASVGYAPLFMATQSCNARGGEKVRGGGFFAQTTRSRDSETQMDRWLPWERAWAGASGCGRMVGYDDCGRRLVVGGLRPVVSRTPLAGWGRPSAGRRRGRHQGG